MEQRISLVTLGVRDLQRSRRFYAALGWHGQEVQETVFFQAGTQAVVLWGLEALAADAGVARPNDSDGPPAFGGIALAHNVRTRDEVDRVVDAAQASGAEITKHPAPTFYGGYAAYFRDPDGHLWEVAWNPGLPLGPAGELLLPDLGDPAG